MKIPCVCDKGWHSFSANELVQIIAAFQRGEMQSVRMQKGRVLALVPKCLEIADFDAGLTDRFSGPCNVEMPDGTQCRNARGHREGRHGVKPKEPTAVDVKRLPSAV